MPAAASAASQRLSPARAIAIASSDPKVRPLLLANPGAHWEAVYDKGKDSWTVVLEPIGSHLVLATYRIDDDDGTIIKSDVSPPKSPPRLNSSTAEQLARRQPKLQDWIDLYPKVSASASLGDDRVWTVRFYDPKDNEVAEVKVDDNRMEVTEVRTGPQVGWMQARGLPDTYGRLVNRWWLLLPMSLLFIAGLMDWRRPVSLRTLDLLVLSSFAISLRFFNHGEIFWATPLVYPPMLYLAVRMIRVGFSSAPRRSPIGPTHTLILVAAIFALVGFRLGLNNQNSNILDVGYASVVGADRLIDGRAPWGSFPTSDGTPCAGYRSGGDPVGYVQRTSGRCESPVSTGGTYGPSVYVAYVPFVAILGWSGLWDDLPAAHVAASAFDIAAILGLFVAGWRLGSRRLGVLMAFGWAANPFTLYALNLNTNDALVGALLAWMMALLAWPAARGAMLALAALSKLSPFCLVPLMFSLRHRLATLAGFVGAGLLLCSTLFLHGGSLRTFWDETMGYQLDRVTPLSIWTLPAYHPGWPDIGWLQQAAQVAVALGLVLLAVLPRGRKDAAAVAALAGAAMLATQMVSSYWFYPYVCWWLPLVLLGLMLPRESARPELTTPIREA
jgi:Glycosyltransferase family 87